MGHGPLPPRHMIHEDDVNKMCRLADGRRGQMIGGPLSPPRPIRLQRLSSFYHSHSYTLLIPALGIVREPSI